MASPERSDRGRNERTIRRRGASYGRGVVSVGGAGGDRRHPGPRRPGWALPAADRPPAGPHGGHPSSRLGRAGRRRRGAVRDGGDGDGGLCGGCGGAPAARPLRARRDGGRAAADRRDPPGPAMRGRGHPGGQRLALTVAQPQHRVAGGASRRAGDRSRRRLQAGPPPRSRGVRAAMVGRDGGRPRRPRAPGPRDGFGDGRRGHRATAMAQVAGAGPVLLGRSTYHETRELVQTGPLRHRVRFVDENDPASWRACCPGRRPWWSTRRATALRCPPPMSASCWPRSTARAGRRSSSSTARAARWPSSPGDGSPSGAPCAWWSSRASPSTHSSGSTAPRRASSWRRGRRGGPPLGAPRAARHQRRRLSVGTPARPDRRALSRRLSRIERNAGVLIAALSARVRDHRLPLTVAYPGSGGLMALSPHESLPTEPLARLIKEAHRHRRRPGRRSR